MNHNDLKFRMKDVLNELLTATYCIRYGPTIVDTVWTCYMFEFYWTYGIRHLKVHCGDKDNDGS